MNAPDAVYICRSGDDNEELRYSLRSLVNIPHGRVFLVGDGPSWVKDVEKIIVPRKRDKQDTAEENLRVALTTPQISDPFLLMNDDFFIMQPLEKIPVWDMGDLKWVISDHAESRYRTAMERTYQKLLDLGAIAPVSFELHMPMLIEKVGMLLALSLGQGIHGVHNRTLYGNLMGLESEYHPDMKVYRKDTSKGYEQWPFISTSDRTFRFHPVGRYIQRAFLNPGPYEYVRPKPRAHRYRESVIVHPRN